MFLYLRRSFQRRPLRHFSLFWILVCAFLLPLVISVYRDSLAYGVALQDYDISKGQAVHISGAQPEDTALFQNVEGLTEPHYEDGIIYMTYSSKEYENQFQDANELVALSNLLKSRARQSERDLNVGIYDLSSSLTNDPSILATLREIQLVNFALLLFSGLIIQAAFQNHIDSFLREITDILAVGAAKGQIICMFLMEFALLFPLSAACAVGISYGVMRLLFERYLGNTAASAAIWRVFRMDPKSTMWQIVFYLLICLASMIYALLKKPVPMHVTNAAKVRPLRQTWMRRTKAPFASCLCIIIPLLTIFIILFNQYLGSYAKMVYSSQSAEISLYSASVSGFSQSTVDSISNIGGVDRIEPAWDPSEPYILRTPDRNSLMVLVHSAEELPTDMPQLEKYQIVSDLPQSMESSEPYFLRKVGFSEDEIEVALVKRVESEDSGQSFINVYAATELIQELAGMGGYSRLIVHTSASQASAVEEKLRDLLSESATIFSYQNYVDTQILQEQGKLWLLSWIFGILMIAAMQIVWARLSKYVCDCAPMLQIILQVGASQSQLLRLIPAAYGAVPAAVFPFLIAIPWALLDSHGSGRPFIVSAPVVGIYLSIAVLAAASFYLPIRITMGKILKQIK